MKIVNIIPGFGGVFYCGNCLRDSVFFKTLKQMGHDAVMLPIYLPLTNYSNSKDDRPVFYGAVNIYLKQNYKVFRNMPAWLYRFFDSKPILKFASSMASSTRATGLEAMTISMLKGSEGMQHEELNQLIDYLKHHEKPDVVHLSNALLLGLAKKIKTELNIPVVCSLQDEDVWVDAMNEPHRSELWKLMNEQSEYVDAFVSVSDYFAKLMKSKMKLPESKLHNVHIGVTPQLYKVFKPSLNPPIIGYLSRLCEENGLGILVDAFIELKKKSSFVNLKLRLTGGMTGDDKKFMSKQIKKLRNARVFEYVEIIDDFRFEVLHSFFDGLSVLSVPVLNGEAFGLYQIESLASGIPVIQPNLGAFPEIAEKTKGGMIYDPNSSGALAKTLESVLNNPSKLEEMSIKGREAVVKHFDSAVLTKKMISIYEKLV